MGILFKIYDGYNSVITYKFKITFKFKSRDTIITGIIHKYKINFKFKSYDTFFVYNYIRKGMFFKYVMSNLSFFGTLPTQIIIDMTKFKFFHRPPLSL